MTFDYSILQKNLHDLRVENRISQADLAKELGFSRHTYLNYETGILHSRPWMPFATSQLTIRYLLTIFWNVRRFSKYRSH